MDRRFHRILAVAGCFLAFGAVLGAGNARAQYAAPRPTASPEPTASVSAPSQPQPQPPAEAPQAREIARHLEQLAPDDRDAFVHNLEIWRSLPIEERESLRKEAGARVHAEVEKALQESGLHLDPDRREVFALRYTQERRKLERNIQRQAAAERARQLPEILERLKVEFGSSASGSPVPASMSSPAPSPTPASVAKPAVSQPAPTASPASTP